ncbi:OOP family OmpA-OmpF porin/outer membrane immunogenic protein [Luteibacter rhizovicinus]|uniref:OOP family OmpA-OmpF porin/outer membrane immunogenic protein n=1 Tax=Luteibacter rhizovicinus TaxID=242606 RepID=A0A4V2W4G0_9GAMM|nr:porin family protein [Luteibacter rhizovicinus]TCV95789.1 OOP family OmpA-OmpF porin/outer membrane immunogenic protein [Luteibacter rhizovicinus]
MSKKTLLALSFVAAGFVAIPAFAQDSAASVTDSAPAAGGNFQPNQPVGSGNWFIGATVGRTNGSSNGGFGSNASGFNFLKGEKDRRTGYGLLGGYRWKVGNDLGLGLEAGYVDLGNYRVKNIFNSGDVNQRSSENALRGWTLGVNGKINLVPQWYISARGGFFYANDNNNNYNNSVGQDLGLSNGGRAGRGSWYAGVGTGWDINEHFGVGLNYDYYHANAGKIRNDATGVTTSDLKRSTGIISLAGEYRF